MLKDTTIPLKPRFAELRSSRSTSASRSSAQRNTRSQPAPKSEKIYTQAEHNAVSLSQYARGQQSKKGTVTKVLASPVCKGRERSALELLAYTDDDADMIITKLGCFASDAERERRSAANAMEAKRAENRAMWKKVMGNYNKSQAKHGIMAKAMRELKQ